MYKKGKGKLMNIFKELNNELKLSMRSGDVKIRDYIRTIKSRITEHCVSQNIDRTGTISDEISLSVISAYKKSLEKAVSQFQKGNSDSPLINEYKDEILFCEKLLPDTSNKEKEILELVSQVVLDLEIKDVKQLGKAIGFIMKNNKGLDGDLVRKCLVSIINKNKQES